MKILLITYFTLLLGNSIFSQTNETWTAFWNDESELMGFKNSNGQVMIEPKFMGFTIAREFDNIIAVTENNNGKYENYYLTKTGREIGLDSLHIYDNGADCESESFIRFRDKKTDKVGMFDKNGDIVIPAIYNELSRVHNGMIWALKDAEKKYWDNHKESSCKHYRWEGGKELLLSVQNKILVENFKYDGHIDFYSLSVQDNSTNDSTKTSFKGTNGQFYSFTDLQKHFHQWLKVDLLHDLSKSKLLELSMDSLTYWKESDGWVTESKSEFINRNFELISKGLQTVLDSESDNFVSTDGLNPFMYVGDNYDEYFNTCGEAKREKYPVMDLILNEKIDSNLSQDHFEFLKTDKGYRLISLTIRNGKIK